MGEMISLNTEMANVIVDVIALADTETQVYRQLDNGIEDVIALADTETQEYRQIDNVTVDVIALADTETQVYRQIDSREGRRNLEGILFSCVGKEIKQKFQWEEMELFVPPADIILKSSIKCNFWFRQRKGRRMTGPGQPTQSGMSTDSSPMDS